jgi:hypothetical protein
MALFVVWTGSGDVFSFCGLFDTKIVAKADFTSVPGFVVVLAGQGLTVSRAIDAADAGTGISYR